MKEVHVGRTTGLKASPLVYGTGALHRYRDEHSILIKAFKLGVTFWDTADQYGTHGIVRKALKKVGRENVVVQTKILSSTAAQANRDIKRFLDELGTSYLDIVLIHHPGTIEGFKKRKGAWETLKKYRKRGLIKNIGFSTHSSPELVSKAPKDVDVILASINEQYIAHGTLPKMLKALKKQKKQGKYLLGMKLLGAGKHVNQYKKRLDFAINQRYMDAYLLGMRSLLEIKRAVNFFNKSKRFKFP